ncbi:MAG: hypothetical protein ACWA5W_08700 [Phycisphaerales bacterium]
MKNQNLDQNRAMGDGRGNRKWRGLVGLNAVLLGTLGVLSFSPWAGAQSAGRQGDQVSRVRGDYVVVGGANIGGVASVIYVVDTANGEMIALDWNDSTKSLEGVGYRDLRRDATSDPDR